MFRLVLGVSFVMLLQQAGLYAQQKPLADTIRSNPKFLLHEFYLQVPLGQTFISPAICGGQSIARYHLPPGQPAPMCMVDTTRDMRLRSTISMGSQTKSTYMQSSMSRGGTVVSYQVSGSMTVNDDPSKYILDLKPDASVPMAMRLNLGYGSARLDLTELQVKALEIVSGSADVFINYSRQSPTTMAAMSLSSGMAKIVVRNLEYARAEQVKIENGMGDTKIVVGKDIVSKSLVRIDVGTGKCTLLVHKDAPIKVMINGTVFSSAQVPEGFTNTGDNTFVSHAYKLHPQNAMTVVVDLGIGGFEMIPFE